MLLLRPSEPLSIPRTVEFLNVSGVANVGIAVVILVVPLRTGNVTILHHLVTGRSTRRLIRNNSSLKRLKQRVQLSPQISISRPS